MSIDQVSLHVVSLDSLSLCSSAVMPVFMCQGITLLDMMQDEVPLGNPDVLISTGNKSLLGKAHVQRLRHIPQIQIVSLSTNSHEIAG